MTETLTTDLCVIGAGSGGLSIAAGAVQMGARVVLLEGGRMGGDCLNTGCVPSKALIAAAAQAHALRQGGLVGAAPVAPAVDFAAVMAHVRGAIETIAPHDSQERFEGLGVRVIREMGHFVSPNAVEAGGTRITARRFVIATGSSPLVPDIAGLHDVPYLTNETLFDLNELPEHLLILGAGPIGLEMAQAFRRLGSRVTVLEAAIPLATEDRDAVDCVLDQLRSEGVAVQDNAKVIAVGTDAEGLTLQSTAGTFHGSHLLVAAGRVPNTDGLGLKAAGVATDPGGIVVDAALRSSNRRVFAIGDVAGQGQFTHLAGYHAGVTARTILFGLPARARTEHVPHAVYTDPEVARIGLTEAEARDRYGPRLQIVRQDMAGNDRAITSGRTDGFARVLVVGGRPVGVTIVGPHAGELIGVWAVILANGLKMKALTNAVLPYPTLGEINKRVAGAYFSPKLFDNVWVKKVVGLVQRLVP